MKHLVILYNIYFTLLMTIPCSHMMLHSGLINNTNKLNHSYLSANNNHKHDSSKSHNPCAPFCVCGVTTFVLNIPPFNLKPFPKEVNSSKVSILQATIWIPTSNQYRHLAINEIWHPPQQV